MLEVGDVIDGIYEVSAKLGSGGSAVVYRCRHRYRGREFAIKLMQPFDSLERFQRERQLIERIQSQHVVKLLDIGRFNTCPYLVLEYVDGGSLETWLKRVKHTDEGIAAWIAHQTISGLRAAQAIHRDLKPDNLLLTRSADGSVAFRPGDTTIGSIVKIADFELARSIDAHRSMKTRSSAFAGTPAYMSPEQCRSRQHVTFQTDIYALGIILYELLAGHPPFAGDDTFTILDQQVRAEPIMPSTWSPRMTRILRRCLQKSPDRRYRSYGALQTDLHDIFASADPIRPGRFAAGRRSLDWLLGRSGRAKPSRA